jgi:hypothetical protein
MWRQLFLTVRASKAEPHTVCSQGHLRYLFTEVPPCIHCTNVPFWLHILPSDKYLHHVSLMLDKGHWESQVLIAVRKRYALEKRLACLLLIFQIKYNGLHCVNPTASRLGKRSRRHYCLWASNCMEPTISRPTCMLWGLGPGLAPSWDYIKGCRYL